MSGLGNICLANEKWMLNAKFDDMSEFNYRADDLITEPNVPEPPDTPEKSDIEHTTTVQQEYTF